MNLYWGEVGSVLQGGWAPSSNLRSTWGFGWWWYTPAGVVASVAACVPIVSRYNERCGVSHTTGQRRNSLFTLCVLTPQLSLHCITSHCTALRHTMIQHVIRLQIEFNAVTCLGSQQLDLGRAWS